MWIYGLIYHMMVILDVIIVLGSMTCVLGSDYCKLHLKDERNIQ